MNINKSLFLIFIFVCTPLVAMKKDQATQTEFGALPAAMQTEHARAALDFGELSPGDQALLTQAQHEGVDAYTGLLIHFACQGKIRKGFRCKDQLTRYLNAKIQKQEKQGPAKNIGELSQSDQTVFYGLCAHGFTEGNGNAKNEIIRRARVIYAWLERGTIDVNFTHEGKSLLHYIATIACTGDEEDCRVKDLLEYLIALGADVNRQDSEGYTPLHRAAYGNKHEMVKMLLRSEHTNVNVQNSHGNTALHGAAVKGYAALVKTLLRVKNIEVNVRNNGYRTPLDLATTDEVRQLLREAGGKTTKEKVYENQ